MQLWMRSYCSRFAFNRRFLHSLDHVLPPSVSPSPSSKPSHSLDLTLLCHSFFVTVIVSLWLTSSHTQHAHSPTHPVNNHSPCSLCNTLTHTVTFTLGHLLQRIIKISSYYQHDTPEDILQHTYFTTTLSEKLSCNTHILAHSVQSQSLILPQ